MHSSTIYAGLDEAAVGVTTTIVEVGVEGVVTISACVSVCVVSARLVVVVRTAAAVTAVVDSAVAEVARESEEVTDVPPVVPVVGVADVARESDEVNAVGLLAPRQYSTNRRENFDAEQNVHAAGGSLHTRSLRGGRLCRSIWRVVAACVDTHTQSDPKA